MLFNMILNLALAQATVIPKCKAGAVTTTPVSITTTAGLPTTTMTSSIAVSTPFKKRAWEVSTFAVMDFGSPSLKITDDVLYVASITKIFKLDSVGNATEFNTSSSFSVIGHSVNGYDGSTYISDRGLRTISRIDSTGAVSIVAGNTELAWNLRADGQGDDASFYKPFQLVFNANGGDLFIVDGNRIRKMNSSGYVSTFTGSKAGCENGPIESATFNYPAGMVFDQFGNLVVADSRNHRIRLVNMTSFIVSTIAGTVDSTSKAGRGFIDGQGSSSRFNGPDGLSFYQDNIFVADLQNNAIRMINASYFVTTVATFYRKPKTIVVDSKGVFYVSDHLDGTIRKLEFK